MRLKKVVLKWSCPLTAFEPVPWQCCWILSRKTLQQRPLGACWNRAFLESIQQLLPMNAFENDQGVTPFQNHLHQSHLLGQIYHPEKKKDFKSQNKYGIKALNYIEILIQQYLLRKIFIAYIFNIASKSVASTFETHEIADSAKNIISKKLGYLSLSNLCNRLSYMKIYGSTGCGVQNILKGNY